MKTIKQFSESKAAEKGERDVGSKAYTDYVTDLTPGAVTNTAVSYTHLTLPTKA